MATRPTRRNIEPGIVERVNAAGDQLGLEIYYKDAEGKTRRRSVKGGLQAARDQLAKARVRRTEHEIEPSDPRVTFNTICDAFETAHVASLRTNSQGVYKSALTRLRKTFGRRRITSIGKADVRKFVAAERREGLKANTVISHLSCLSAIYSFARDDLDMPVQMPRLKPSERPNPADDARERRILVDDELALVLEACLPREQLYFRTLAETGARESEVLGLIPRRVGEATIAFREQLSRDNDLRPLKTRQSKRTIEVTRALAAELRLTADRQRVFQHLDHGDVDRTWRQALKRAAIADPQPTIHDLRHTHVSRLIADGWDPQEIADRIGDTLATVLKVYAHAFDHTRRGKQRQAALEALYGDSVTAPPPAQVLPIDRARQA